jgi:hypothetical protein
LATAQAQTAFVTASATTFSWAGYYNTITITNAGSVACFARTDGVTTSGLSGNYAGWLQVPAGMTSVFLNGLPLPNANSVNVLGQETNTAYATQVQVASSSSTAEVTVEVQ